MKEDTRLLHTLGHRIKIINPQCTLNKGIGGKVQVACRSLDALFLEPIQQPFLALRFLCRKWKDRSLKHRLVILSGALAEALAKEYDYDEMYFRCYLFVCQ